MYEVTSRQWQCSLWDKPCERRRRLKARGDLAPYTYSLNKSGAVTGQWLITTPEGTVAVLKAGGDGTVYLATTLEPQMAAAQAWVCNPPKPPHRSNNNRTFSQGGSHDLSTPPMVHLFTQSVG